VSDIGPIAGKLKPLLLLLSSNQDGEVIAAVNAVKRTLKSANCDFHDLVAGLTSSPSAKAREQPGYTRHRDGDDVDDDISGNWRAMRDHCWRHEKRLREREREFIHSLNKWRGTPTPRQLTWLRAIFERINN
jgi:hypothetical protein